jgi:dihydrofolate synthase/folylpolyglutamate synthase
MVSDDEMSAALDEVRAAVDRLLADGSLRAQPTFFEVVTAMALVMFRRRRVDIAVLEVGLGGRLDATTVATPIAGAITSIDLDHQAHLGSTIRAIATEKAGIVKPGMVVVCGERKPDALEVIEQVCSRQGASLVRSWEGIEVAASSAAGLTTIALRTPVGSYAPCTLALRGAHQVANAVVAVRLLETLDATGVSVSPQAVVDGLAHARWRGRLELVRFDDGRQMLLDAAHNPAGAESLAVYLRDTYPKGVPLVFGAMQDKDIEGMLRWLAPRASHIVLTLPPSPRAADPADIVALLARLAPRTRVQIQSDPSAALACAFGLGPTICVAGSIYLLGAILRTLPPHAPTS